jgi:carboxyl-terminal processing protease
VFAIINDLAIEQKGKLRPDFAPDRAWTETLYQRLTKAGVTVDRAQWDAGRGYVDRQLEERVAKVAFGDTTVVRHGLKDDPQLQRAIALLKNRTTQKELFAVALGPQALPASLRDAATAPRNATAEAARPAAPGAPR